MHSTWTGREPASLNQAWVLSEQHITAGGTDQAQVVYHPASHFWPLQGIETAIFGGLALALILFAGWWTNRRSA